jgi:hypothetical protein
MAYDQFGTNFKEKFRQGLKSILKYDIIFKSPIWGYSSVGSATYRLCNTSESKKICAAFIIAYAMTKPPLPLINQGFARFRPYPFRG